MHSYWRGCFGVFEVCLLRFDWIGFLVECRFWEEWMCLGSVKYVLEQAMSVGCSSVLRVDCDFGFPL